MIGKVIIALVAGVVLGGVGFASYDYGVKMERRVTTIERFLQDAISAQRESLRQAQAAPEAPAKVRKDK